MKKYFTALLFACLSLLVGCNGSSGDNDTPSENQTVNSITLAILNAAGQAQQSFQANDEVQLLATVLDANGQVIAGRSVSFDTTIGNLTVSSRLTNDQGQASVTITNSELAAGAGTATATIGEITASSDFEFLQAPPAQTINSITLAILNEAGQAQQSFQADDEVQLVATVLDNTGQVIIGRTVSFETTIGNLAIDSRITNDQGQASVTVTNTEFAAGAGTATATIAEIMASGDFEFLQAPAIQAPSLASQLLVDGQITSQFKADQQAQIIARLTTNTNQPIVNEIVTFTADIGTLNTTTALTNNQGEAKVTLASDGQIGAGVVVASLGENSNVTPSQFNYEIIAADAVIIDEGIRIGHIDASGTFTEGEILLGSSTISAGGTLGLAVDLVDAEGNRINTPTPVSFSSNCVQSDDATIDESVFTIQGRANATFEDLSCAGSSGIDDVIVASITVNGVTSVASSTVNITGEQLGSIEFISAEPTSIVLKGTGGQGKQETSTLTFSVKSALDNPLAQQAVDFSLSTQVGGMTLSPASGLTNSQGIVTVKVTAGTVPTAVRVSAKSTMQVGNDTIEVQTQSDLLSVNTGLPEQRSMTLSTDIRNPEAARISGVEAQITARLADNFNNPVPDGTTVNFTTEGGAIQPSCTTVNGACSVTWTSAEPRVPDHRITILATALGHETFFDSNGNNTFDDNDGSAIINAGVSSGRGRQLPQASGFVDMSEAWRDDDEDNQYDTGEVFLDFNNDNSFTAQDGLFNGPQCQGTRCAVTGNQAIHVRKAIVMIMASSEAAFTLQDGDDSTIYETSASNTSSTITIPDGGSTNLVLSFSDTSNQAMPRGTTVNVSSTVGELQGTTSFTVPDTLEPHNIGFNLSNPAEGDAETGLLIIDITSPSGVLTSIQASVVLVAAPTP